MPSGGTASALRPRLAMRRHRLSTARAEASDEFAKPGKNTEQTRLSPKKRLVVSERLSADTEPLSVSLSPITP